MASQILPLNQLDQAGVIFDTPPSALPPNGFSDALNVRFKNGAVNKMKGEVNIFPNIFDDSTNPIGGVNANFDGSFIKYIAWWPNPNLTIEDSGYYLIVREEDDGGFRKDKAYLAKPGATALTADNLKGTFEAVDASYWQHTLFQGGFALVINNGHNVPHYILDLDNTNVANVPQFKRLPNWDSYYSNEVIYNDSFVRDVDAVTNNDFSSLVFNFGQEIDFDLKEIIVKRTTANGTVTTLTAAATGLNLDGETGTPNTIGYEPASAPDPIPENTSTTNQFLIYFDSDTNTTIITLPSSYGNDILVPDTISIELKSKEKVHVSCGVIKSFGDFLVAGNLVERDSEDLDSSNIIRSLTGVIRTSDAAKPGTIPINWNPFAAGVSTADEFIVANTGVVQEMVEMQGNLYIYSNDSIQVLRLTGNASVPIAISPVTNSYGCQTNKAVVEFNGVHFVVGSKDIYVFEGHPGSIKSVSDKRVREFLFEDLNTLHSKNLFCLKHSQEDEIWVCYPSRASTDGTCNTALIWNYRSNNWTKRTLNNVVAGNVGPVPGGGLPSVVLTFSGTSGDNGVYEAGAQEVRLLSIDSNFTMPANSVQMYTNDTNALMYGTGRNGDTQREVDGNGERPFYQQGVIPVYLITGPDNFSLEVSFSSSTELNASEVMDAISTAITEANDLAWSTTSIPSSFIQTTNHTRYISSVSLNSIEGQRAVDNSSVFEITKIVNGNSVDEPSGEDFNLSETVSQEGVSVLRATPTHIGLIMKTQSHSSGKSLVLVTIGDTGDYDPVEETGTVNGISYNANDTSEKVINKLKQFSSSFIVTDSGVNEVTITPANTEDIDSGFIDDIIINDSNENAISLESFINQASAGTIGNNSFNDEVYINPSSGNLEQHSNAPAISDISTLDTTVATSSILEDPDTIYDIDRPWPQEKINPNLEVPLLACRKNVEDSSNNEYTMNKIVASDIGWSYPSFNYTPRVAVKNDENTYTITNNDSPVSYESFIERQQLAVSPEFDTETISRITLWTQGNSKFSFEGNPVYNRLQIRVIGTDNPGQDQDLNTLADTDMRFNNFFVSENYKLDIRANGRYLNYRITDKILNSSNVELELITNENSSNNVEYSQNALWQLSGIQAEVIKGGGR